MNPAITLPRNPDTTIVGSVEVQNPPRNTEPHEPDATQQPEVESSSERLGETVLTSVELNHLASIENSQSGLPPRIGRFEIRKRLGAGAFGEVFLGYDAQLNRQVAIKCPKGALSERVIQNFLAEAQRLAQLQHPGIVVIFDAGRELDQCFIVTEYLEGQPLSDRAQGRPSDWMKGVEIISHLATALGHAHSRGIMHRDIKPANIMMTVDGRVVLMDFGLAVNDLETTRGEIAGTPSYMSPEQILGESHRIDGRTDIFALGVILYELLTGRLPFRSSSRDELFRKILNDAPQPIRQLNPAVSPAIDAICMKALSKDLDGRYTTAYDFAELLQQAIAFKATDAALQPQPITAKISQPDGSVPTQDKHPDSSLGSESMQTRRLKNAQFRHVTLISFGFDVSPRGLDTEEQHAISEVFSSTIEELSQDLGGCVHTSSGHEIEICFGFPQAWEDSVSRAIHCGMKLLKLAEQQRTLPRCDEIVIAIHTGQVVAEETVHGIKLTGETTQTLRRLLPAIEPGAVVVTESVHKSSRIYFQQESLGTVTVRGIAEPIALYRVLGEAPVTLNRVELVDPGNLTPLVGRDTELSILKDRWEQAAESMGQVVLLIGEAGLGKSRLIREIREYVVSNGETPDVIELRCSQYHQSAGLYPMIEHFSQLLQFDGNLSTDSRITMIERYLESLSLVSHRNTWMMASFLGIDASQLPAQDISPQKKRELTAAFLLDILRRRAELRPVLFIVEDLHWVDPTLVELLTVYVAEFEQKRALSIFTFRPEFETPWRSKQHQTQIALNRLTKRQIRDMMQKRMGRNQLPDIMVEQIVKRTDGIPLFIEEFSTLLMETSSLEGGSITESVISQAIPASLQDLLMARLDRMASDPEVIQLAAAIGREFSFAILAAASERSAEELQAELEKLVAAEVLFRKGAFPDASFIFKHALIQDSAYNSLLKKRRVRIHASIGAALEDHFPEIVNTQPELIAHHFTEAGDAQKAAAYWFKAGVKAQSASANIEAIRHLTQGLEILKSVEASPTRDQLELGFQLTLAPVLMAARGWSAPEVGTAIERARQLVATYGALKDKFFVMWGLWGWRLIRSELDIAAPIAAEIMQLADSSPEGTELLAEAHWVVGATAYYKGEFKSGLALLERGLALVNDEKQRAHSLLTGQRCSMMCRSHTALALWALGFPDRALQLASDNVRLGKEQNHPFSFAMALYFRRQILQLCGLHEQASQSIEEENTTCHENGFVFFEAHAILGRGDLLLRQGKTDEARKLIATGLEMQKATGGSLSMDRPMRNIAEAYLLAGYPDDAREWLNRGFELINIRNERGLESEFLRLRGQLALAAGDQQAAEADYRRAIEVSQRQQARSWELRAMMSFAGLKKIQGNPGEGRQMVESIYSVFTEGFDTADLVLAKVLLDDLDV